MQPVHEARYAAEQELPDHLAQVMMTVAPSELPSRSKSRKKSKEF